MYLYCLSEPRCSHYNYGCRKTINRYPGNYATSWAVFCFTKLSNHRLWQTIFFITTKFVFVFLLVFDKYNNIKIPVFVAYNYHTNHLCRIRFKSSFLAFYFIYGYLSLYFPPFLSNDLCLHQKTWVSIS